uniref:Putative secreted protein n=1 Tax=Ixodes ricinus TaxID=34613 RepID=A0A6B0U512_IXORI
MKWHSLNRSKPKRCTSLCGFAGSATAAVINFLYKHEIKPALRLVFVATAPCASKLHKHNELLFSEEQCLFHLRC